MYAINKRIAWVTGADGVIMHTKDGGENWTRQGADTAPHDVTLWGVYASDANHVWVVGDPSSGCNGTTCGTILHTKNGGRTWERQPYGPNPFSNRTLLWVHGLNARTAWVVGAQATGLHTTDGGKTWQVQKPITGPGDFNGVFAVDKNTVWVSQDYGGIYKYDGSQWQDQNQSAYDEYYILRISALDAQTAWTVGTSQFAGDPGLILHTTTGGDSWESQAYGKAIPSLGGVSFVKSGFCNPNREIRISWLMDSIKER